MRTFVNAPPSAPENNLDEAKHFDQASAKNEPAQWTVQEDGLFDFGLLLTRTIRASPHRRFLDRRVAASPRRRIAASPRRRIAASPHRRIAASCIAASPHRRIAASPHRRIAAC